MQIHHSPISEWVDTLNHRKPFYLAIIDKDGQMSFTNSHFYSHFRPIHSLTSSQSFFDLVHQADRTQLKDTLETCSLSGHPATAEIRIKNGHLHWVKWEISPVKKTDRQPEKFLCLGYDIACEEQQEKTTHIFRQHYQAIVEDMNLGLILQDAKGLVVAANQKAAEILHTTLENLYTKKVLYSLWKTSDEKGSPLSLLNAPFMKALRSGTTQNNVVLNFQLEDGCSRTILCKSQPLFEKDQSVPYSVISSFQDITKEKEFEMESKARNALFTSFMDHTPYFTWIVDEEGTLEFANRSLLEYFGLDNTAFGKKLVRIIPGPIAGIFDAKHAQVLKCDRQDSGIIKSLMADGKEHVYQVNVFPIHGAAPGTRIGGEALDITESYLARQEEKRVSEQLLYISKATAEAIWDWNIPSGQIYFNQALHDLVGTDLGQVFDLDWYYRCIHPDDHEAVERSIRTALEKEEQSWESEYRFRDSRGQYRMMHSRGFIIYEHRTAIRMIGSLQDISEIRRLETQLVKQKLKQQKGTAETIIQAQEEERTRIGHELHDNINQILSSAQLYLSLLHTELDNFHEIKEKTAEIIRLAIEEIRLLSRKMVLPDLKGDGLVASIDELIEDLRYAGHYQVSFVHSDTRDIELMSQSKKITLFRIVQEQTKNIIRYSHATTVEISVHCNSDQVRLHVKDDGIGFDPKTTRRGLGLSNIYERTRLYNGKVILTTAPGQGCSLIVNIPFESHDLTFLHGSN